MPPTRRTRISSGGGPATKGAQKTLSFGNSKISKSSATSSKDLKPSNLKTEILSQSLDLGHVDSSAAVVAQAEEVKRELKRGETEEERRARRITDAQIKKYWRGKEGERLSGRGVHQEGLSVEEKVLRLWDVSSQFGPAIGIARMKRWVRANKLGLNPPIEVLAVLLKEEDKGNTKIERAYVDELMSSKFVIGEA